MKRRFVAAMLATTALAITVASLAGAAKVKNGGFESGDFSSWTSDNFGGGAWAVYGPGPGPAGISSPPEGSFAAVADQGNVSDQTLVQYVRLKQGKIHRLSFQTYYDNDAGVFITPDSLSVEEDSPNQQYRADVLRAGGGPSTSTDPRDVLLELFATEVGDPQQLSPTPVKADLSLLGDRKVRLRFGVAVTEEELVAAVDDVQLKTKKAPKCDGEKPTIVGTNGDDKIKGTRKNDVIVARGGDDKVKGRGGEDVLCGDAGRDNLNGGKSGDFCDPGGGPGRVRKCEL